jgi:ABC-2 type transport system permease protein
LLIVKPTEAFSSDEKLKIDQYVMRGGKVVWFLDNLHAEQDSLRYKPTLIAYDRGLNLDDLLFRYGVRINPDLLMDLQCDYLPFAVGGSASNPQFEFLHWNYYPLFEPRGNHLSIKTWGLWPDVLLIRSIRLQHPALKKRSCCKVPPMPAPSARRRLSA